jgi:catechol 2,3-dioxygenase-like lactoylglutathione lyase family enzyme
MLLSIYGDNMVLASATNGLPGLCGTDHIGFTVPNLEQAVDFFVRVIGCEVFYPMGPVESDGTWMADRLNVHPRARIKAVRLLRCGNGSNFEVFEYEAPDQSAQIPRNSDIGGHHLAFYVEDIERAVAYLEGLGIVVLGKPEYKEVGPDGGEAWVYFLAPWGMQLELVSYPNGKNYEKEFSGRLWHPAFPDL